MKNRTVRTAVVALLAGIAFGLVTPTSAQASTYSNSSHGSDVVGATTLGYASPHGNFNLRIWVTKDAGAYNWSISDKYSIKMYDRSGRMVWSAGDQTARTYGIGGNVTKIVISRNSAQGASTHWQK